MKLNLNLFLLSMLLFASPAQALAPKKVPVAHLQPQAKLPKLAQPAQVQPAQIQPAQAEPTNIPYLPELRTSAAQPAIINAWQTLYQTYQARTATPTDTTLTPAQITAMAPLFEMNHFTSMQQMLTPQTFPKLPNDPQGSLHTNYATFHLNKALTRLASISSIEYNNGAPTVKFTGDNRDMGIIVNIQNNTDAQFSIIQSSVDGKVASQIGQLIPGLNEVNLHTAALQAPANPKLKDSSSAYAFDFYELDAQQPTFISIRMYTGAQLIAFLQSLPRKDTTTVEMNGLPTSPQYLANPKDWYMVLIQNPTLATNTQRNPDQRIQAINVSKLTGPYLLTMQINKEIVEIKANKKTDTASETIDVFQPSFTTALQVDNKIVPMQNYPLIILPQFLWSIPTLQTAWMLLNSSYIASLSNFKFFGSNSFGNALQYFTNMGCFNMKNKCSFFIDLFNTLPIGTRLFDASWLMGSAIYDTNVKNCSDIPQLYSGENDHQDFIGNNKTCFYVNFQTILHPQNNANNNFTLFTKQGFYAVYTKPEYQLWTLISSLPASDMQQGVFAELIEKQKGIYQITWTSKKNKILQIQYLYLNSKISTVEITFVSDSKNWNGSFVPQELLKLKLGIQNNFKVTYEAIPAQDKYMLAVHPTSPIDKHSLMYTTDFSTLPISELYYDLFQVFKGAHFTRCHIIKNSDLPTFLSNLSIQDWQNGIYFITNVDNQHHLSIQHPGSLTVTFYKSDKTMLGSVTSHGLYENNPATPGIRHPVMTSIIHSNAFKPLYNIFLSTGVFLKYSNR